MWITLNLPSTKLYPVQNAAELTDGRNTALILVVPDGKKLTELTGGAGRGLRDVLRGTGGGILTVPLSIELHRGVVGMDVRVRMGTSLT